MIAQQEELRVAPSGIEYNVAQVTFCIYQRPFTLLEWGRGTGKSTIIAKRIIDCVVQMPRSLGLIVGETYAAIKTKTLPSTLAGLELHGYLKGVHYVVDSPPLSGWQEAYQPPLDYKNTITFWNGTTILLLSQDNKASSGRGMNIDFVIADEAARLDEDKFNNDVVASNRGNLYKKAVYPDGTWKYFKDIMLHHSILLASTTPVTESGMWILKWSKLAEKYPKKYLVLRAPSVVNIKNLGKKWFKFMMRTMPKSIYDAEILNLRNVGVKKKFYPLLNEKLHCYNDFNKSYYDSFTPGSQVTCEGDSDLDYNNALDLSLDWGTFNSMTISQLNGREYRFLKTMHVQSPLILQDLVEKEFIPYYMPYLNKGAKRLNIWYDATGNYNVANSRLTYAQEVRNILVNAGFFVELMTKGLANNSHEDKYFLWNKLLKEEEPTLPVIRINSSNCQDLVVSMSLAPASKGKNVAIQKVKTSEKNKSMPQEHATHLSDCADNVVFGRFGFALNRFKQQLPKNLTSNS